MDKNIKARVLSYLTVVLVLILFYLIHIDFEVDKTHILLMFFGVILLAPFFFLNDLFHPIIIFNVYNIFIWLNFYSKYNSENTTLRYYQNYDIYDYVYSYSLLVIIVWFLFFYVGYYFGGKIDINKRSKQFINKELTFKNPKLIGIVLFFISALSFIYLQYTVGGIGLMIENMVNRREMYSGLAYITNLILLGGLSSIFLLIAGYRKTSLVILLISSLFMLLQGGRSGFIFGIIIPYIIIYNFFIKKIRLKYLIILTPIVLLAYEALGNLRLHGKLGINSSGIFNLIIKSANSREVADILPSLIGALHDNYLQYGLGKPFLNIIYAPIPRSFWSDKPIIDDAGYIGYKLMGEGYWGLPMGPYGWAYYNFSWIGVILFSIITGFLVGKIAMSLKNKNNLFMLILYSQIFLSIFEVFQTSSQISIIKSILILVFIYYFDKKYYIFMKNKEATIK